METATIRIPEEKKNLLKAVASLENRKMNDILVDLIDDYVERRQETLELLAIPGLLKKVKQSQREFREGQFVSLEDVRKDLERRLLKGRPKSPQKTGKSRS